MSAELPPKVLDIKAAARFLGIGVSKLKELRRDKAIQATKIGRRTLFKVSELERFLALATEKPPRKRTGS